MGQNTKRRTLLISGFAAAAALVSHNILRRDRRPQVSAQLPTGENAPARPGQDGNRSPDFRAWRRGPNSFI